MFLSEKLVLESNGRLHKLELAKLSKTRAMEDCFFSAPTEVKTSLVLA